MDSVRIASQIDRNPLAPNFSNIALSTMKFNLSKTYTETQMEQIDQAIAASKAGVSNQEILTDLKSVFQDVDIRRIEQVINASKSQVELAEQQLQK